MKESDIDNFFLNIRGVGPWTLCSLKMFYLSYSDVFITGDLAINKACSELMLEENSPMIDYAPYRTYLCLYLWASLNQT
jgi:3-methyladenine DNA glycosylase/8-oxoguanine DNA glycosylase